MACILLNFNFSSYFQVLFFGLSLDLPLFSFSLCMFTEILGFFRHGGGGGGGVGYEDEKDNCPINKETLGSWKESPDI